MAHLFRWIAQQLAAALFRIALDPVLKRHLPAIFTILDRRLPLLLPAGPSAVQELLTTTISTATGITDPTPLSLLVSQVEQLYSPTQAAKHAPNLRDIFTAIEERNR